MEKKKDLVQKLRSSGLRPTKQRLRLAECLFNKPKTFHFTVENLDKVINKKGSDEKIALATVYNTVHAFEKAGHLKKILLSSEGKSYFDTNTTSHHHFYDEVNNELVDIESNNIELKKLPTPPKGKSIKNVNVIINIDNDTQNH
ncbi:transcriptional repressor [Pelagibacteraceae bacterium]|jgi:Fur family transcriptional regulator, iron response regulator|nr:transcriptional repressor [Pelagibacteraceae bacterium]MDC1130620.1 Fur family transcriptional regulator [Pelagibacteraceae bacterium]